MHYTQIFDDGMSYGDREVHERAGAEALQRPVCEIPYEYDFGTTSELVIKVVDERQGKPTTENPIVLMARNNSSHLPAPSAASQPSAMCTECVWEDEATEPVLRSRMRRTTSTKTC